MRIIVMSQERGINVYLALVLAGCAVERRVLHDGSVELIVREMTALNQNDVLTLAREYDPEVVATP